jgi:GT2 family glycosyltransferase
MDFTSVLVVNFNGRRFLDDCLSALERQTLSRRAFETLLIDNGSTDDSVAFVRSRFPSVRVIALARNCGFTGANNVGFRLARGRNIVLLNNDTRADPDWLRSLVAAAARSGAGGVASRIVFRNDPNVLNSTGLRLLRDGRGADRDLGRPDSPHPRVAGEVFGGCGAALLLRRELIDDLGGFDPKLFMYYEDLDLAWRSRLRGWRFVYEPTAVVEHVCGGSSEPASSFVVHQVERNRALIALRNAPAGLALWSSAGLAARIGREVFRCVTADSRRGLTSARLRGMTAALMAVIGRLPERWLARYETRVARRRRPDRDILRWTVEPS